MKTSTILDHIDSGHFVLPEIQRNYDWNRDQVRTLMLSIYRLHPMTSLLNEGPETISIASEDGFRPFTSVEACRRCLEREVLGGVASREERTAS